LEGAPLDARGEARRLSRTEVLDGWFGLVILVLTALVLFYMPIALRPKVGVAPHRFFYLLANLRIDVILLGVFLAAYCLVPAMDYSVRCLRKRWRDLYTYGALLGICAFLWLFLLHFGRWQFGAWDFNLLIETGWRQVQGQKPYLDFPTTTPPGFNLGIKYAYQLFGVNWDANLYVSAIFGCLTFLWMYWLMVRLTMGRLASMGVAFSIECAAMLTTCHWWFNDTTLVLAAVFFLSCLVYEHQPQSLAGQVSYVLSLLSVSLMKPNIAGVMIVGSVILLFLSTSQRMRLIVLTLTGAVAAVGVLLIHHVSIRALLASYLSVMRNRVGLGDDKFGYLNMGISDRHSALLWIAVLSTPLLGAVPKMGRQIFQRDWKSIAIGFFFPLALIVALVGLATNSDYRDVECTVLLAASAVLTFGLRWNGPLLRRVFIAILCASIAGDLYYGAARIRVYGIGPRVFFEWQDNEHRIESGFLGNARVGSTMIEVMREVKLATDVNPGPYFFGPRLEFNYAALALPSPEHSPALWDPGAMFPVSDEAHLVQNWREHQFQTLIFLKSNYAYGQSAFLFDYTFYSEEFLDAIRNGYVADESYPFLTIYHRRLTESRQP